MAIPSLLKVCHSRMLLAGIQANLGLDPRLKHSGVTTWGKVIRGPLDTPQLAAGLFIRGKGPEGYTGGRPVTGPVGGRGVMAQRSDAERCSRRCGRVMSSSTVML